MIVWDRLILPNGKSLALSKEPGVDAQGAVGMGVTGEVDRRLLPLAVATLFSGAITAVGEAARDHTDQSASLLGDAGDAASIEAAQVGGKLIDRELDVHPVIRLRQGERVRVLITRDVVLEPIGHDRRLDHLGDRRRRRGRLAGVDPEGRTRASGGQ